jgi:hypothetical protein
MENIREARAGSQPWSTRCVWEDLHILCIPSWHTARLKSRWSSPAFLNACRPFLNALRPFLNHRTSRFRKRVNHGEVSCSIQRRASNDEGNGRTAWRKEGCRWTQLNAKANLGRQIWNRSKFTLWLYKSAVWRHQVQLHPTTTCQQHSAYSAW